MGGLQLPAPGSPATGGGTPTAADLTVHDVNISQQPMFTPQGVQQTYVVRYFIGSHGPFLHQYQTNKLDQAQVSRDIQEQVDNLALVQGSVGVAPSGFAPGGFVPGGPAPTGRVFQLQHSGTDVGFAPSLQSVLNWFGPRNPSFTYVQWTPTINLRPAQWSALDNSQVGGIAGRFSVEWASWGGNPAFDYTLPQAIGQTWPT